VEVRPAKDGAHRPPQSAGAVRGQASASRQPHPAYLSIRHHLCPERLTIYSSSSQGSGNSSSSILFNLNREPAVSWHLAFAAEAETPTPQGPRATSKISNPALRKTDRPQSKSRLKVHLRHLANMGPSENATRPSLASFDGVKTGQESVRFERPTDLDALARKWSTNTGCESGVGVLSGGGKVAVVDGRSGSVLSKSGLRGKTGCHAGLRSEECRR